MSDIKLEWPKGATHVRITGPNGKRKAVIERKNAEAVLAGVKGTIVFLKREKKPHQKEAFIAFAGAPIQNPYAGEKKATPEKSATSATKPAPKKASKTGKRERKGRGVFIEHLMAPGNLTANEIAAEVVKQFPPPERLATAITDKVKLAEEWLRKCTAYVRAVRAHMKQRGEKPYMYRSAIEARHEHESVPTDGAEKTETKPSETPPVAA